MPMMQLDPRGQESVDGDVAVVTGGTGEARFADGGLRLFQGQGA